MEHNETIHVQSMVQNLQKQQKGNWTSPKTSMLAYVKGMLYIAKYNVIRHLSRKACQIAIAAERICNRISESPLPKNADKDYNNGK